MLSDFYAVNLDYERYFISHYYFNFFKTNLLYAIISKKDISNNSISNEKIWFDDFKNYTNPIH